jgi:hypothetical protein
MRACIHAHTRVPSFRPAPRAPAQAAFIPLHPRVRAARCMAVSPNRRFAAVAEELWPLEGEEARQVLARAWWGKAAGQG